MRRVIVMYVPGKNIHLRNVRKFTMIQQQKKGEELYQ